MTNPIREKHAFKSCVNRALCGDDCELCGACGEHFTAAIHNV